MSEYKPNGSEFIALAIGLVLTGIFIRYGVDDVGHALRVCLEGLYHIIVAGV